MDRQEAIWKLEKLAAAESRYNMMRLEHEAMFPSATSRISGMPKYNALAFEPERWAIKREAHNKAIDRARSEAEQAAKEWRGIIGRATQSEALVLVGRYVHKKEWPQLAADMNCHRNTVMNIHNRAIQKIAISG